jgi:hypothetical protein
LGIPIKLPETGTTCLTSRAASPVLSPAIAAVTLRLVGRSGFGERLGRNARFMAKWPDRPAICGMSIELK